MAYKHGVYVQEQATSLVPPVNVEGCVPVVIGTAPIHLASKPAKVNKPVVCYSYADAVEQLGYSDDWKSYTLCEAMYTAFSLYGVAPIIFINVLDPAVHKEEVANEQVTVTKKVAIIEDAVILDTLKVTGLTADVDYVVSRDDKGNTVITIDDDSSHASDENVTVSYTKVKAKAVTKTDIIGGVDIETGANKGLEVLEDVFSVTSIVPGVLIAPGWSNIPEVAAVMATKVNRINGVFRGVTFVDLDTISVKKYSDVPAWKNKHNYTSEDQYVLWPRCYVGDKVFHMSSHAIGVNGVVLANNDDIPYESPSNKSIKIEGTCLYDGTEVVLNLTTANYLNGNGVATAINHIGGWKLWGDEMACYPANTDPKDRFLCVRMMFNWHRQTFIRTYFNKVDGPLRRRNLDTIVNSERVRLNGLVAQEVLIAGDISFTADENPTTSLIDGIVKFHQKLTPPVPMRDIEDVIEFDTTAYESLFS